MKRGNEEKVMGPMFPRLHVNDADKGGPRAPPRNKMALYEQLSIPSQRFNSGVKPRNPSNTSNVIPQSFSNQGSLSEGNSPFPHNVRPSTPTHQSEMFHARQSDGANVNMPLEESDQRKKVGDEDDFRVPILVQSGTGLSHSKTQVGRNVCKKDPKQISSAKLREVRSEREEDTMKASGTTMDHLAKSVSKVSNSQKVDGPIEEANASPNQESADYPVPGFNRLCESDACLQQESRSRSLQNVSIKGDGRLDSTRDVEKETVCQVRSVSSSGEDHNSPNEPDIDSEYHGNRACITPQMGHIDKSDDVSETSMVDSISGVDISPDDVVGIIGQKHFWKARKAIVNQQRLFAVQVFELHRLIKVQRLIAESPHLLLEDNAFLGTSTTLRGSPAKKLASEYVVKPLLHVVKRKHEAEKPDNKLECSAENAVGKTSLSSVLNASQTSIYGPYLGNSQPTPVAGDNKANPWYFHQTPGHQLLIPVMSPSEGLVYKPYNGPGFTGPASGGYEPFSSTPMTGNFVKPHFEVPGSHHQGMGVLSVPSQLGRTYFPPYGMSIMNPAMPSSGAEQMHWFAGPGSHGQIDQLSGGGANSNMQHQSSCNMPTPKNGASPQAKKFQPSNDSELQGSSANSPGDRAVAGTDPDAEGRDALQLFPTAPVIPDGDTGQPTRAIKVVPHNPRTATASAARIFQSIQEERKQHDSI